MSSALATATAIGLYLGAIAPALVMFFRPQWLGQAALTFGFLVVGLGIWQTGIFDQGLTPIQSATASKPAGENSRCRQIVDLLIEGGAIRRSPDDGAIVVVDGRWAQLPAEAQAVARDCFKAVPSSKAGAAEN